MKFEDCFALLTARRTDELVITSAGNASELWWTLTGDSESTFYLEASMSLASMFAAGIARGIPQAKIWAFSGDGAFAMNPGMLMVERQMALPNMTHFLVSNRVGVVVDPGAGDEFSHQIGCPSDVVEVFPRLKPHRSATGSRRPIDGNRGW